MKFQRYKKPRGSCFGIPWVCCGHAVGVEWRVGRRKGQQTQKEGRTTLKALTPVFEGPAQVLQMWSPGEQMLLEIIVLWYVTEQGFLFT